MFSRLQPDESVTGADISAVGFKTIHIASLFLFFLFPEEGEEKKRKKAPPVSKESGQVNAKKSVVQYKQFNCVINNQ